MYSRVLPSDTGNRRDLYPVLWTPNAEICFVLNLETKPACCRLFGNLRRPFGSTWRTRLIKPKAVGTYSSYTFTAQGETAPGGLLGGTARSTQLNLTTGDSSFPPLSRWRWSTSAQGWAQATRERREPLSSALKQRWVPLV